MNDLNPAQVTTAEWARRASGGSFICPPHIQLWDEAIMRLVTGESRRLIIEGPIRHGKSTLACEWLPPYFLGSFPGKTLFMLGHNDQFATKWGRKSQRIMDEHGWDYFRTKLSSDKTAANDWECDNGSRMISRGLGGSVMGEGAHGIIIDDLFKSGALAENEREQEDVWGWWTDTVYGRQEPGCWILVINARWNDNDFVGKIKQNMEAGGEHWDIVTISARNDWPEDDPLGRAPGEALWPERYDEVDLARIEANDPYIFACQWQSRPSSRKGGRFDKSDFRILKTGYDPEHYDWCLYWDQAASEKKGDYTVGALCGLQKPRFSDRINRRFLIASIHRGRWGPGDVDREIRENSKLCRDRVGHALKVRGEQEGGSSGKKDAAAFVNMLQGFDVAAAPNTGDKEIRARPLSSQVKIGNVYMVEAPWNNAALLEFDGFPNGKNDDIVDACSGAYNELITSAVATRGQSPTRGHRGRVAGTGGRRRRRGW